MDRHKYTQWSLPLDNSDSNARVLVPDSSCDSFAHNLTVWITVHWFDNWSDTQSSVKHTEDSQQFDDSEHNTSHAEHSIPENDPNRIQDSSINLRDSSFLNDIQADYFAHIQTHRSWMFPVQIVKAPTVDLTISHTLMRAKVSARKLWPDLPSPNWMSQRRLQITQTANSSHSSEEYSCPCCDLPDDDRMIQCFSCHYWIHYSCVNLPVYQVYGSGHEGGAVLLPGFAIIW